MGKVRIIYHLFNGRQFEEIVETSDKGDDKEGEEAFSSLYAKEYCMYLGRATDQEFITVYRNAWMPGKDAFIINARAIEFIEVYDLSDD